MSSDEATQERRILYLTSCDARGRDRDGSLMINGRQFTAPGGYPALPWGCGSTGQIELGAPRWLVLEAEETRSEGQQVLIVSARVLADGDRTDALRYLHHHGAAGMPYLGRRRAAGDFAVIAVGSLGNVEANDLPVAAGGEQSKCKLGGGATAAVGQRGDIEAGPFSRLAGGDHSKIKTDRFSQVAAGGFASLTLGDGSLAVAGPSSECTAGAGSRVLIDSAGAIDLGERATGIGRFGTRFKGKNGALFVAIDAIDGGVPIVVSARVGEAGVKADQWYVVKGHTFEPVGD
jgi:hypothetical protein